MKYEDYGSLKPHNITGTYPKCVCDQCVDYLELRDPDYIKAQLDKAGSLINWVTDVLMIGEAFDGGAFIAWGTLQEQRRLPYIVKNDDGTYETKLSERTTPGHNFLMEARRTNECARFLRTCKEEPRNWLFIVSKEPDGFWARGATFATWYTRDPRFVVMHMQEEPDTTESQGSGSVLLDEYRRKLSEQRTTPPMVTGQHHHRQCCRRCRKISS